MYEGELINLARSQIGLKEATGNNDGPEIEKFTGNRKEPWCAHFVAWLFREIGKPLPTDIKPSISQHNPLASVSHMKKVFDKNKWTVAEPVVGGVVFFTTRGQSDSGPGRHVGVIESVESDCFFTIEGNWGNSVKRVKRKKSDKTIWSYGKVP